jgi:hypothetical protein
MATMPDGTQLYECFEHGRVELSPDGRFTQAPRGKSGFRNRILALAVALFELLALA